MMEEKALVEHVHESHHEAIWQAAMHLPECFQTLERAAAVYNEALRVPCLAYPDAAEVDAELQAAAALRAKRQPLLGAGPQHAPSPTFPSLDDIYTPKLSRLGSRDGR